MSEVKRCRCCGRFGTYKGYAITGGMHFWCWDEHHSDPTTEWPPGHECAVIDIP